MNILKFEKPVSNTHRYHISISSKYKWGYGWNEDDAKEFRSIVYPALLSRNCHGFYIIERKYSCESETLCSDNENTNVYLHPMDFSGYMTDFECDAICSAIARVPENIAKVISILKNDCYDISDEEYINILENNRDAISKWIADNIKHYGEWGITFEFARRFRIPRVGDGCGMCSDDVDIKWVSENFCKRDK